MSKNALVIGAGFMGKIQAKAWKALGFNVLLLDVTDTDEIWETVGGVMVPKQNDRRAFAAEQGMEFELLNTDSMNRQLNQIQSAAKKSDVVSITSPTQFHVDHLNAVVTSGPQRILLEKAVALNHDDLARIDHELIRDRNALIGVNFIERAHPAYQAVLRYINEHQEFKPYNDLAFSGIFWRQHDMREYMRAKKCPPDHPWGLLRDGSHDVSEMHGVASALGISHVNIGNTKFTSWIEKYDDPTLHHPGDCEYNVVYCRIPSLHFTIRGAKDDDSIRRFFVITNYEKFVFCSTMPRPNLGVTPCVWVCDYNQRLLDLAYHEDGVNHFPMKNDEIKALMQQHNGVELELAKINPQDAMCANLLQANTEDELLCSLSAGIEIDELVMDAYVNASLTVTAI